MSVDIKHIDDVLSGCEVALPVLRTMLEHERLAGVDIAERLLIDIRTLRATLTDYED